MATRQYIGARYVPKFYDYNGSTNWRAGVEYENLTIVTRNGNSYTSKKPVPSNIGEPENNPEYWVSTGLYNEQVEAYRQLTQTVANRVEEVATDTAQDIAEEASARVDADSAIEDRIDEIESVKPWVFLSDSYGSTAGNASGETETMYTFLREISGRNETNLVGWSIPGGGFLADGVGSFKNYVDTHYSEVSDRDKVEKFVVVAGRNDHIATANTIVGKMREFVGSVKQYFPNSEIYFGYIANGTNSGHGTRAEQMEAYFAYMRCPEVGGIYLNGTENILCDNNWLSSDLVHPTKAGKKQLAYGIWNAIKTGSCSSHSFGNQALIAKSTITGFTQINPVIGTTVFNNMFSAVLPRVLGFPLTTATTFTRNAENQFYFGDIDTSTGCLLAPYGTLYFDALAIFNSNGTYIEERVGVKINSDGEIGIVFIPTQELPNITYIELLIPAPTFASTVVIR